MCPFPSALQVRQDRNPKCIYNPYYNPSLQCRKQPLHAHNSLPILSCYHLNLSTPNNEVYHGWRTFCNSVIGETAFLCPHICENVPELAISSLEGFLIDTAHGAISYVGVDVSVGGIGLVPSFCYCFFADS